MDTSLIKNLPTTTLVEITRAIQLEIKSRNKVQKNEKRRSFISQLDSRDYSTTLEANKDVDEYNASKSLSIPKIDRPESHNEPFLCSLILQDWTSIYKDDSSDAECDFYVYAHVDPGDRVFVTGKNAGGNYKGRPFYIGKGKGNRAYDLKRNQGHGKKLKDVLGKGWGADDIVYIAFDNLSENKAYEIESKLIYFFGTIYENHRKCGLLYNLDIPKKPKSQGIMEKRITRKQLELKNGSES